MNKFILIRIFYSCIYAFVLYVPTKRALHMFQQNRYERFRYTNWLKEQINITNKDLYLPSLYLVLVVVTYFLPMNWLFFTWITVGYGIIQINKENKRTYIKPLNVTMRVVRQIICMVFLYLIFALGFIFFTDYPWFNAAALLVPFLPYACIYLMDYLTAPIENMVKAHYQKQAQNILKNMDNLTIVGITGSYGKTSSKNILQAILSEKFYSLMTPASFNTPMGITRTIKEYLKPTHEVFICEMGADKVNDIEELMNFVHPKYGVVTSIGPQHLNTFRFMENIVTEKMKMIEMLPSDGVGFINLDNKYIREYKIKNNCKIITVGIDSDDVDYRAINIKYSPSGTSFDVLNNNEKFHFETKLLGKHNISNILTAIAVARELNVSFDILRRAVMSCEYVEHRLELKKINGYTFIDNAFNSNPSGANMSLEVLSMMPNKRFIVTPGMIDLGSEQNKINHDFGFNMLNKVDYVILVGKNQTKPIYEGLKDAGFNMDNVKVVDKVFEAFNEVYCHATPDDTILLENDLPDAFNK